MEQVTLASLSEALAYEAGIDGIYGTNARHGQTQIWRLIERQYLELRAMAARAGEAFFRERSTPAPLPAPSAGEDFITIAWPTHPGPDSEERPAAEALGVEVHTGGGWHELTPASFRQRRVFAGANRPDSPGEWSIVAMPRGVTEQASGGVLQTALVAGALAVWPASLAGKLYSTVHLPQWSGLPDDPNATLVLFPHWREWLLASCAMVITQRDNDKRNTFQAARDRKMLAQAQLLAHARRLTSPGSVVARRRDGMEL